MGFTTDPANGTTLTLQEFILGKKEATRKAYSTHPSISRILHETFVAAGDGSIGNSAEARSFRIVSIFGLRYAWQ